ncbi:MAG TPA: acyltransferase [Candidatus Eisenbacteria bacterium]|nr:acyltransferase [Candidatus Eisenbacteria bacterium]
MPLSPKRIPSLDGLRAVSIVIVLIGHLAITERGGPVFHFLHYLVQEDLGVTIFFVISGFLITTLLLNEKFSDRGLAVGKFYARRGLRILPVCALYILIIYVYGASAGLGIPGRLFVFALTFSMNFAVVRIWLLAHLWSLAVEEQFYLLWPWVIRLSLRSIAGIAFLIVVLAPVSRVLAYLRPEWRVYTLEPFLGYADSLMAGCLLAVGRAAFPRRWETLTWGKSRARYLCVLAIWATNYHCLEGKASFFTVPFGRTLTSACVAFLLAGAVTRSDGKLFRLLNHPLCVYVGTLSYSLYIWQEFFIYKREWGEEWWHLFPVNLAFSFLAAAASYHLWEKTFLKMRTRFQPPSSASR